MFFLLATTDFVHIILNFSSGKTRQSAAPRRQFAAPYVDPFFCSPLFFPPPPPWRIFPALIIFCPSAVANSAVLCSYIIFCPSTVVKLDKNLPILLTNLQNDAPKGAAPPLAGSAGPFVTPLNFSMLLVTLIVYVTSQCAI